MSGSTPSPPAVSWRDPHVGFLLLLLGLGVLIFWFPRLPGSLWVDETTTAWTVDASFGEMLDRAVEFQSMAPTYFIVAWVARVVGGASEIALRIPSLLATATTAYLLYRLGRRLFDPETGLIAATVFVTWNEGAHLATDARPYALGILAFVGATLSLVRWVDERRTRDGVLYVLLAVAVVYVHYLLAPPFLAHVVYLWKRRDDLASRLPVALGGAAFGILLLPLVPIVLSTLGERAALSLGTAGPGAALLVIFPPAVLVAMAVGIAAASRLIQPEMNAPKPGRAELALLGVWAAAPPIALLVISVLIGAGVLGPQHVTQSAPAIALLAACAIRRLGPAQVRRIILVCMALVSLVLGSYQRQYTDDWRGAFEYANGLVPDGSTPVLVRSGLVQGRDVDWLTDAHRTPLLLAPAEVYLARGNAVALPFGLSADERRYLEDEVLPLVESVSRVPVVSWSHEDPVLPWLQGRLGSAGFELERRRTFGLVVVALFERI